MNRFEAQNHNFHKSILKYLLKFSKIDNLGDIGLTFNNWNLIKVIEEENRKHFAVSFLLLYSCIPEL
jgi:hypothetical protein